jgi:hypothetical protein
VTATTADVLHASVKRILHLRYVPLWIHSRGKYFRQCIPYVSRICILMYHDVS